jgi:hypothetical protein
MTEMSLTRHAISRMDQRAIADKALELIMSIGTEVKDGYLVRAKDCQAVERQLKRLIDQVWRLKGKRVIITRDRIVTAYHARRAKERRLLRHAEERSVQRW